MEGSHLCRKEKGGEPGMGQGLGIVLGDRVGRGGMGIRYSRGGWGVEQNAFAGEDIELGGWVCVGEG